MANKEIIIDNGQPTAAYFDQLMQEDAWKTARFGEFPSGDIERDVEYTSRKLNAGTSPEIEMQTGADSDIPQINQP